ENDMLTVAVGIEEIARAYGAVGHARAVQIEQRAGDRGEDFLQNHAFGNRSLPVLINEAAARALKNESRADIEGGEAHDPLRQDVQHPTVTAAPEGLGDRLAIEAVRARDDGKKLARR